MSIDSASSPGTGLKKGALGLGDVYMQAVTHIAPATAMLFTIPFISSKAGIVSPISYLAAFLLILIMGSTLAQLAKHLPSAGGYYTYISHTISPRAGFLTSWLCFLCDPVIPGFSLAFAGAVTEQVLLLNYGIYFPWWLFLLLTGGFVMFSSYRGIEISAKLLLVLGLVEIVVVLVLSLWGLFVPGNGGINLKSFNPANAPNLGGLAMSVVFSVFAFVGWEGVAPLAEESRDPRKTLPKAIVYSIVTMGVFLVLCSWSLLIGWGTDDIGSFMTAPENPSFILARKFWGPGWIIVLFAFINSMLAASIACNNSATRIWYAMARSGSMPRGLSAVHKKFQTPRNAVYLQMIITFAVGLGLGALIGPEREFDFMGLVITYSLALVYTMGNIGVIRFYWKKKRDEFNVIRHLIFPSIGIIVLGLIIWNALNPWPEAPFGYSFWVVVTWLFLGAMALLYMKLFKKESWIANAGNIAADGEPEMQVV